MKSTIHFARLFDWTDRDLSLYVDNTAAVGALRRMYSSCTAANDLLEALHREMVTRSVRLRIVSIPGLVNPADGPSRFTDPQQERLALLHLELIRQSHGRIGTTEPWSEACGTGGIRHREM